MAPDNFDTLTLPQDCRSIPYGLMACHDLAELCAYPLVRCQHLATAYRLLPMALYALE